MKFANLIHNGLCKTTEDRIINLGDAFEIIAIDRIYARMGIDESRIKYIDLYELETYKGEKLILPINFLLAPYQLGVNMLNMSSDIIPVFLGVSFSKIDLNQRQLDFLKKWQPIGCRDEYTKEYLIQHGIEAYLAGCLAITIQGDDKELCKKRSSIVFIDVPLGVAKYIPQEIKNDIIFMNHEYFVSYDDVCKDNSCKKRAKDRIKFYDENAKLIVTSRFHGAVIALALGIPVILVMENNYYKFSWLSKLIQFYDKNSFDRINWMPEPIDVSILKKEMINLAIQRIKNTFASYEAVEKIQNILSNPLRDDASALRYASSAIEYISSNWKKDSLIEYGLWGINDNAESIYQYINNNYKNAKLLKVYDGIREVSFHGMTGEKPGIDNIPAEMFLFVSSNTANKVALQLFNMIHKKNFFLCNLAFMSEQNL